MAASLLDSASVTLRSFQFRTLRTRAPESQLLKLLDAEIIPRLARHGTTEQPPLDLLAEIVQTPQPKTDPVQQLAALAMRQDQETATELLLALHIRGWPLKTLYLQLMEPAARLLGELWEQDRCSFVDVSLGTAFLQRVLREFSMLHETASLMPGHHHRVLLLPAPGEQHIFGISMLGEFFRDSGWDVCGGPRIDSDEVLQLVRHEHFDAVGYSAASQRSLEPLARQIEKVRASSRNQQVRVLVGGNAVAGSFLTMQQLGADATATDAEGAVAAAMNAVGAPAGRLPAV